ncbi:MAG TPA: pyruvate dehydrogenase complex dihydrolipoamide acetyltransferase [Planctomycetota bacterium]|nr:pyruvate dehydrogenase complex dihydrolipoamide acetyltransferase [Planctomycetota bacterium]
MAIIIEMPKLSDTMSEGKILSWMKKEGDAVAAGEILAEIESDKASMEMEAYDAGYLRKILVPAGGSAPVGARIAIVTEDPNEDISQAIAEKAAPAGGGQGHGDGRAPEKPRAAPPAAGTKKAPTQSPQPSSAAGEAAPAEEEEPDAGDTPDAGEAPAARKAPAAKEAAPAKEEARGAPGSKIIASPLAARMASEMGLDLAGIRGSGPGGRIVKRDVLESSKKPAKAAAGPAARRMTESAAPGQSFEDVPITSMRRIIGARLRESATTAPHFYATIDVDMKAAVRAREELNKLDGVDVTYNDIVVKAVAVALTKHPGLNASLQGEAVRYYRSVDIGVAVALPEGLITPVVRGCHLKSLGKISAEIKELAERARAKKLTPDDYKGGTFTISNLGMYGVQHFTAIINPPEACILAVGAIQAVPVVEGESVVPGRRMSLTLSSDHRVVDGAQAGEFLRDLKRILENPVALAL